MRQRRACKAAVPKKSADATPKPATVTHDSAATTFTCGPSHLDYTLHPATSELEIWHTYVPPRLRGRGLAAALCDAAYAHASRCGLQVRPTCSYVRDVYEPRAAARCLLGTGALPEGLPMVRR